MQIRPTDFFLETSSLGLDEDDIYETAKNIMDNKSRYRNLQVGQSLMRIAAHLGHSDAQYYVSAQDMRANPEDRNMWLSRAFDGKSREAALELAISFNKGSGVEKNLKEAYAYAREACGDRLRGFIEKDNRKDYAENLLSKIVSKLTETGMSHSQILEIEFEQDIKPFYSDYYDVGKASGEYQYLEAGTKSESGKAVGSYSESYKSEFKESTLGHAVSNLLKIDLLLAGDSSQRAVDRYLTSVRSFDVNSPKSLSSLASSTSNLKAYNKLMSQQIHAVTRIAQIDPKNPVLDSVRLNGINQHVLDRKDINEKVKQVALENTVSSEVNAKIEAIKAMAIEAAISGNLTDKTFNEIILKIESAHEDKPFINFGSGVVEDSFENTETISKKEISNEAPAQERKRKSPSNSYDSAPQID